MDRVLPSEGKGRAFEPRRERQCRQSLNTGKMFYVFVNGVAGFVVIIGSPAPLVTYNVHGKDGR